MGQEQILRVKKNSSCEPRKYSQWFCDNNNQGKQDKIEWVVKEKWRNGCFFNLKHGALEIVYLEQK